MPRRERHSRLGGLPRVTTPWRGGAGAAAPRDMELLRELLFEIEGGGGVRELGGWSDDALRDHLRLLIEAGLLAGSAAPGGEVVFSRLTWAGHDFLAAVRHDGVWARVRARLAEAGGGLAFEAVKHLALSLLP